MFRFLEIWNSVKGLRNEVQIHFTIHFEHTTRERKRKREKERG